MWMRMWYHYRSRAELNRWKEGGKHCVGCGEGEGRGRGTLGRAGGITLFLLSFAPWLGDKTSLGGHSLSLVRALYFAFRTSRFAFRISQSPLINGAAVFTLFYTAHNTISITTGTPYNPP